MRNSLWAAMIAAMFLTPATLLADTDGGGAVSVQVAQSGLSEANDSFLAEYEPVAGAPAVNDPIEPWNRFWYGFNDKFYFWLLKPISQGYAAVIPEGGRSAVRNVFHNAAVPIRLVNTLLQGKFQETGVELGRFGLNTVVGVGGLFDVAEIDFKLPRNPDEDLGQTLGVYGLGEGLYLVWPILGPSSLRDTVGLAGDYFVDPLTYWPEGIWERVAVRGFKTMNATSLRIGEYEELKEASMDPYVALRDAYVQHRREKVQE